MFNTSVFLQSKSHSTLEILFGRHSTMANLPILPKPVQVRCSVISLQQFTFAVHYNKEQLAHRLVGHPKTFF